MLELIEYSTILIDHPSSMAHTYRFPSSVRFSVMSFSHSASAASAVNRRSTRSFGTDVPISWSARALSVEAGPLAGPARAARIKRASSPTSFPLPLPLAKRMSGDPQHPACHCDGNTVGSEVEYITHPSRNALRLIMRLKNGPRYHRSKSRLGLDTHIIYACAGLCTSLQHLRSPYPAEHEHQVPYHFPGHSTEKVRIHRQLHPVLAERLLAHPYIGLVIDNHRDPMSSR